MPPHSKKHPGPAGAPTTHYLPLDPTRYHLLDPKDLSGSILTPGPLGCNDPHDLNLVVNEATHFELALTWGQDNLKRLHLLDPAHRHLSNPSDLAEYELLERSYHI